MDELRENQPRFQDVSAFAGLAAGLWCGCQTLTILGVKKIRRQRISAAAFARF